MNAQSKQWYFGYDAGLDFRTGTATATIGSMTSIDGCAAISDDNGNILFYTNGLKLWDKSHNVTPNGDNLLGAASSCQAAIFVPYPGDATKLILATTDMIENNGANGMRYNIIDLTLNSGKGDIVSGMKNLLITKPACEKIISIPHCNGKDAWLITYKPNTDSIISYKVTSSGIDKIPVKSNTGYSISGDLNKTLGYFKASRDLKKIASAHYLEGWMLLMDFDNATGKVSNILKWAVANPDGVEFSPNNKLLYVTGFRNPPALYQYDITSGNATTIKSSEKTIYTYSGFDIGALQLGPDKKIYMAKNNQTSLGVINNPDLSGTSCNFSPSGLFLIGKKSAYGLPNIYDGMIDNEAFYKKMLKYKDTCLGNKTSFYTIGPGKFKYYWNFGEPVSGSFNIDSGESVFHTYLNSGKYRVVLYYRNACISDSLVTNITINNTPKVSLGNDTGLCIGTGYTLNPKGSKPTDNFLWSTSATTPTITITQPGTYWVKVYSSCAASWDTITITDQSNGLVTVFPKDTLFCSQFSHQLIVNCNKTHQTLWSNGSTRDTITVTAPGNYSVRVTNACGNQRDTIAVEQFKKGVPLRDTIICFPSTYTLTKQSINRLLWQSGDTTKGILIAQPGTYIVTESYKHCNNKDTAVITPKTKATKLVLGNDTLFCGPVLNHKIIARCPDSHTTKWSTGATSDTLSITQPGTYIATVTNVCTAFKDTIVIEQYNYVPDLGKDMFVCFSSDVLLDLPANSQYTYQWNNGDNDNATSISQKGQYIVTVSYKNCSSKDTINIFSNDSAVNQIFIPNAFTPNDDNMNDKFPMSSISKAIDIEIYNRWGEKIYEATRTYTGWDGTYKNEMAENGVYLYMIRYKDCVGRWVFEKGTFTILN